MGNVTLYSVPVVLDRSRRGVFVHVILPAYERDGIDGINYKGLMSHIRLSLIDAENTVWKDEVPGILVSGDVSTGTVVIPLYEDTVRYDRYGRKIGTRINSHGERVACGRIRPQDRAMYIAASIPVKKSVEMAEGVPYTADITIRMHCYSIGMQRFASFRTEKIYIH